MRLRWITAPKTVEWTVLLFTLFAMLWRGGKTLESTWLLVFVATYATFATYMRRDDHEAPEKTFPVAPWILGILFIAWTVVSFALSSTQNYGLDEVLRDGALFLLFLWAARHAKSVSSSMVFTDRLAMTITVGILIACAVGMGVYVLQPVTRFVGTFFNERFHVDYWPNAWADLVLLCWPMAFYALRGTRWWLRGLALGVILGCLFLSYSRGGFLVFWGQIFLLSVVSMVTWGRRRRLPRIDDARVVLITIIVIVATFFAGNVLRSQFHDVESLAAKATFTADEGKSSVSERQQFWNQSFALSLTRPLFGWGPYSFRFVQPRLQEHVFSTSDHPHNVFLKLAMERGWPSAFLNVLFLISLLLPVVWRLGRKIGEGGEPDAYTVAALTAIAGVYAHNMIDYNLQFVGIALPLWLLLGSLQGQLPTPKINVGIRSVELLLAMLLAIVAILEGRYLVTSSLGRHAEAVGDTEQALAWYEESENEIFSRDMHMSRAGLLLADHRPQEAIDVLKTYLDHNAEDARAWKMLGDAHVANRADDAALIAYDRAWEYGKYNYIGILQSTLGVLRRKNDTAAIAALRSDFEDVHRAFGNAILQNAHFIALSQNVEEFAAASALMQKVYPDAAQTYAELTQKVLKHAAEERAKLRSQRQGLLW